MHGNREMQSQARAAPAATLKIGRGTLYGMTAGFMALVGVVFWTAGYAAGLHSAGLLATLFAMGASAALLVVVLWFLSQLRTLDGAAGAEAPERH
jgi:predicted phage tail protein